MAILDIFKKKKKTEKPKEEKKAIKEKTPEVKSGEETERAVKKKEEVRAEAPRPKAKISDMAYQVLKAPQVTEKATDLAGKNQYAFKIWPRANKIDVKKAIKDVFGVDVLKVKIVTVPKKKRRLGRIEGFRKGYKKAIVKIKEGQKIEVLPR